LIVEAFPYQAKDLLLSKNSARLTMTINKYDQQDNYAQARFPEDDDIFVPQSSSTSVPTASMVSSGSSYSPFDPLARPPSTTNSRMSTSGDDTSVLCQPSPTASPPTYNNYDFAATTPSDRSFGYATDRPSALPIVPSATPTAYGYDGYNAGAMVSSNGDNNHRVSSSSTSSYTISAADSDMAQAMPGESDADKKARRRRRRKVRMACGSIGGVVVGGLILGPLGMIAGGVGAGAATRAVSKRREKKKDERVAEQYTSAVPIPMQRGEAA
jgi:hypothetical protein